jgi:mRNA interferase RelE/StbE
MRALADQPWPRGATKLQGRGDTWRIRVGSYRILYRVNDLSVRVLEVGHRRDVYR